MKQLNKQQQKEAIELIEKLSNETMQLNAPFAYYIESAKAFLQSLKPKIAIAYIDEGKIRFICENNDSSDKIEDAIHYNSVDEALKEIEEHCNLNPFDFYRHTIDKMHVVIK